MAAKWKEGGQADQRREFQGNEIQSWELLELRESRRMVEKYEGGARRICAPYCHNSMRTLGLGR